MKKLLAIVAMFAASEASALSMPAFLKPAPEAKVEKVGMFANAKAKAKALPASVTASLRAKISANPIKSVAAAMALALVAEHVASFVYNNYVASSDVVNEEDEDLDIA